MRAGPALGDQLVAHATGEWQVGDSVAVQVAELAAAEPELDPAEAMGGGLDTGPRTYGVGDLFSG